MCLKGVVRLAQGLAVAVLSCGAASAATITVNSTGDLIADDGECTLREAISAANRNAASGSTAGECVAGDSPGSGTPDTIVFAIPGQGPFTIRPTIPLPHIFETVFIDGYSQPGAKPNTLRSGNDAVLMIELRGDQMQSLCDPIDLVSPFRVAAFQFVGASASGSRLRGFAIGRIQDDKSSRTATGVVIFRAGGVQIDGNWIGFDSSRRPQRDDGTDVMVVNGAFNTLGEDGIVTFHDDGGPGNLIGGRRPEERNVIAGGLNAVVIGGRQNHVEGNYIGVSPAGDASLPSIGSTLIVGAIPIRGECGGVPLYGGLGSGNSIGVLTADGGGGNFFSMNSNYCAVRVGLRGNRIEGNFMGTDRDGGAGPSGFGLGVQGGCGVLAEGVDDTHIAYNTIAFNSKGVVVTNPPWAAPGAPPPMNVDIYANSIHTNVGPGIDLGNDDVTANDADDSDDGANGLQNFPEILAASEAGIMGELHSRPNREYRIDLYESRRCNTWGYGEGERYVSSFSAFTDGTGLASFSLAVPLTVERVVTATATLVPSSTEAGSASEGTSEFSKCQAVTAGTGVAITVESSRNPARSRDKYDLTVTVTGSPGAGAPTGVVELRDQAAGLPMAAGLLNKVPGTDSSRAVFPWGGFSTLNYLWGNRRIQARYKGDAAHPPTNSMELVQTVYREKSDFDNDGLSDVLLCDPSTNGTSLVSDQGGSFSPPLNLGFGGPGVSVLGTGEFGTGVSFAPAIVWEINGTLNGTLAANGMVGRSFNIPLNNGETFAALGSVFGDLADDVLVRDANGHYSAKLSWAGWASSPVGDQSGTATPHLERVGDFNGDGNLDLLLRDPATGQYTIWLVGGRSTTGSYPLMDSGPASPPTQGATVAAVADFDGDGKSDIVWQTTGSGGSFRITLQDGRTARTTVQPAASDTLQVLGTAFFDEDGAGQGRSSGGRASLIVRDTASNQLDAWVNIGVDAQGVPQFAAPRQLASSNLTVCAP